MRRVFAHVLSHGGELFVGAGDDHRRRRQRLDQVFEVGSILRSQDVDERILEGSSARPGSSVRIDAGLHQLPDRFVVFVVVVEGELVVDPESNEHGDAHTEGETADVYKRVAFVAEEVPQTDG